MTINTVAALWVSGSLQGAKQGCTKRSLAKHVDQLFRIVVRMVCGDCVGYPGPVGARETCSAFSSHHGACDTLNSLYSCAWPHRCKAGHGRSTDPSLLSWDRLFCMPDLEEEKLLMEAHVHFAKHSSAFELHGCTCCVSSLCRTRRHLLLQKAGPGSHLSPPLSP